VPERGTLERRLDVLSTVLLGVAAIATAWATFQAAHWRSEQGLAGNRSTAARIQATRVAAVANRQVQIDALVFTHWIDAYAHQEPRLVTFYFRRFRPEFRPAVTAWVGTKPLTNAAAPLTPFVMPQYRSAASAAADALEEKGAQQSATAEAQVQRADRYTLCVVLFATALFFAGISTRVQSLGSRVAVVAMGWTLFAAAFIWMVTFPASLTL
jgi:hypothetical protein